MLRKNPDLSMRHISDEDLVRSADGELSSERAAEVDAHLEGCRNCRVRMENFQSTIAGLVHAYRAESDFQVPSIAGPRALLRARLTQLGSEPPAESWKRIFPFSSALPRVGVGGLTLIAIAIGMLGFRHGSFDAGASPNRSLTPGATRQITISEVCSVPQGTSGSRRVCFLTAEGSSGVWDR